MTTRPDIPLDRAFRQHGRHWRENAYCYPVVSRRSDGLSIGINLNPDKACNFDCIYCQVDRTERSSVQNVDLDRLGRELGDLLDAAIDESLFAEPPFDCLGSDRRRIRDIAFSGDGEPTTYPGFAEAIRIAGEAKKARGLDETKLVLITDACYLTKPKVRAGLELLDKNNGEIWAKLDAGTEEYYGLINRPNFPLRHVLDNILDAAKVRPVVIQSLWMNVHGRPPPDAELHAFADRINEILAAGGRINLIQVYTIARKTTEQYATFLSRSELNRVTDTIRKNTSPPVKTFHGVDD